MYCVVSMDALQREIVGLPSWHLASHPGAGVDGNAPYQGYNPWDTNKVLLPYPSAPWLMLIGEG